MHCTMRRLLLVAAIMLFAGANASAQETPVASGAPTVVSIRPNYLPPWEILDFLGVRSTGDIGYMRWQDEAGGHSVDVRVNDAANLIVVSGNAADVDFVEALIREADIPPRQIEIEVRIIEVNTTKAQDIGIDWDELIYRSSPRVIWRYDEDRYDNYDVIRDAAHESIRDEERRNITKMWDISTTADLRGVVKLLQESGAGTIRTAPKILTLNNRPATILDGQRVTYVTRYSSFTNLFETDSMDAGLTLSVLPSLGESGYITLRINAELTTLEGEISGSPIKTGQLIENTVVVKDGESVLLGGLTRTVEQQQRKRFPILGHILPFLFSREIKFNEKIESFMILTPRVVDFSTALDQRTKEVMEGK